MSNASTPSYQRGASRSLALRLGEPRHFIQVIAGPRQVGKTTLVHQVTGAAGFRVHYASADEPTLRGSEWIAQQWDAARLMARPGGAVLVLDEVQKVDGWAESVKRLWDEDTRAGRPLKVVLLGSAPLLVQRGVTESLAGRFEILHLGHWLAAEMRDAFGWPVDRAIFYGGYPGSAPLVADHDRWVRYVRDALIETTIARDVLLLTRVDKPALMRRLFEIGCRHSGQILSFSKMLGQLRDAGNTTTLAHYLELLAGAGMLTGLPKFSGNVARQRGSSPKLQVFDTALMTALAGATFEEVRGDAAQWGRWVESAVGAHLVNAAASGAFELFYWRDRNREVDFVARSGRQVTAIEVKSGRATDRREGMDAFVAEFRPKRRLLVGTGGIPVEEFLARDAVEWVMG